MPRPAAAADKVVVDGKIDWTAFAAWMDRVERLALDHSRQQAEMQKAIGELASAGGGRLRPTSSVKEAQAKSTEVEIKIPSMEKEMPSASTCADAPEEEAKNAAKDDLKGEPQEVNARTFSQDSTQSPKSSMVREERFYTAEGTEVVVPRIPKKRSSPGYEKKGPPPKGGARAKMMNIMKPTPPVGRSPQLSKKQATKMLEEREGHRLQTFVESTAYEMVSIFFVVTNAIYIGWDFQYQLVKYERHPASEPIDLMYVVVFTVEILTRLGASGWRSLACRWNAFDSVVVAFMLLDFVLGLVKPDGAKLGQLSVLRVLRIIRLTRIMRVMRVVRFFREMRVLLHSMFVCMRALVWAGALMACILYIFSLVLVQGVISYCMDAMDSQGAWCPDDQGLIKFFGRVDVSMLSLYEALLGGISWYEFIDILAPIGDIYVVVFLVYISFCMIAVLNIVTGMFVETAIDAANNDSEAKIQEELDSMHRTVDNIKKIFLAMDTAGTGFIDIDHFYEAMEDDRMVAVFASMKLSLAEADTLFMMLDRKHTGMVDINDFVDGFLTLKGQAMSLDIHKVMCQCDMMLHVMDRMEKEVLEEEEMMKDMMGQALGSNEE